MSKENFYNDLETHHGSWLQALELARDHAEKNLETGLDDKAYWTHEIKALDRLVEFHKQVSALDAELFEKSAAANVLVRELAEAYNRSLRSTKEAKSSLLDAQEDLREERRQHQKAVAERDQLRAQLAELTALPAAGRAHSLAVWILEQRPDMIPAEPLADIVGILQRVETNRFEYELGRKVNAQYVRSIEHESWRTSKAEAELARVRAANVELTSKIASQAEELTDLAAQVETLERRKIGPGVDYSK